MNDTRKLRILVAATVALCIVAVAYNMGGRRVLGEYLDLTVRKAYYEGVIKKSGLSEHKAVYWERLED